MEIRADEELQLIVDLKGMAENDLKVLVAYLNNCGHSVKDPAIHYNWPEHADDSGPLDLNIDLGHMPLAKQEALRDAIVDHLEWRRIMEPKTPSGHEEVYQEARKQRLSNVEPSGPSCQITDCWNYDGLPTGTPCEHQIAYFQPGVATEEPPVTH